MIPQETVNLILDTARIEDVVSDFVTLKRRGANFVACCPFHNEKTPSFYVSPSKGIYKCFGCGKAGSAVGFVMEHEHYSYVEALRYLARKYNIEIVEAEESAEEIAKRQRNESLLLVSEFAQKFFASQLESGEGRSVGYQYLRSRGLEDATIAHFGLGWAPSGKDTLTRAALDAGFKLEYLLAAGLSVQKEDGSVADKFRERVMFPIYSVSGRPVAFSGRTLRSDNPAKYVNSADTEIYHKSNNLLGIYHAKAEISRQHRCIIVEGNVDMTTMHQLGITNVVATCGTALTVEQIRLISRFTAPDNNVTIMYDGDSAGIHAALRGLSLVLHEGLNVKIVLLPEGEDPDSFARKHTLEEVQGYIASHEKDFIEFKTDLLLGEAAGDPLKKANLINDIADTIAQIPDAVKRSVYVEVCAARFGIESDILFQRINKTRRQQAEEERRLRDNQQRRREQGFEAPQPSYQPYQSEESIPERPAWTEENPIVGLAEKDLLHFLLRYGQEPLEFESDSEYYTPDAEQTPTVADFIRDAIEGDGSRMANSLYAKVYDEYAAASDEGLGQEEIVRRLLNSEDRGVADLTAELTTDKYQLTVHNFEAALTTTSSWLAIFVPKAILYYAERRIQARIDYLRHSLADAPEQEQTPIMTEMVSLQAAQRGIKQKLGREKKI